MRRRTIGTLPARPEAARPPVDARDRRVSWFLRAGLAFVLSYAASSSLLHPGTFARYFPEFLPGGWVDQLLPVFAMFEALLAVALLTERYVYVASILAGFTMVAIVVINADAFDVLFRNVAIACGAFALAAHSRSPQEELTRDER